MPANVNAFDQITPGTAAANKAVVLDSNKFVDIVKMRDIQTVSDSQPVRINSRNYTQVSGSTIGFQSKPAQTAASSGNVIGGEISPRVNDGIALTGSGSVIGLHVDTYIKGTTASTIAGDVRALQLELVGDDSGQKTITGDIAAIRVRSYLPLAANTGEKMVFKIEKPETGGHPYDHVLELTGTLAGVWNDDPGTEVTTIQGYIKVKVNDAVRYIALYSGAPVD